ncbi:hypothetical protein GYMLUDRAFT_164878 [Collybiopsis luxurians FD-317 M1]|uniref:Uncharacterized protein n=1 Tax=Collybiopsis luxurians FD-317 M1 TaxID=944289 RepID=A0A0D0CSY1_9AGAR|nr:hypothetical protein GYMLUDRAFT_164878 [Collybiopsis luxurians FD-317 M1]
MHPSTIPTISTPGFNGIEPQTTPPQPDIPLTFSAGSDEELSSRPVESEVYARSMLPQKKGYPLWEPKPDEHLPEEYRRVGVRIGDVGFLNESGGFDYLFNVCLPAEHPVNAGRVPPDFEQLLGMDDPRDITRRTYPLGSHIPSNAAHIRKNRQTNLPGQLRIPRVPREVGAGLTFTSSASKGAFLVLPEGGCRTDHQRLTTFRTYAEKHAPSWYAHINGPLAREINTRSIYFITGVDKARAWGVASFTDVHPSDVLLEFVPDEPKRAGGLPEYWFSTSNAASSLSGADDVFENESGCVFLRGFNVAIKVPPFMKGVETKVVAISQLDADDLLPKPRSTGFSIPSTSEWWLKPYLVPRIHPSSSQEHALNNDNKTEHISSIQHLVCCLEFIDAISLWSHGISAI